MKKEVRCAVVTSMHVLLEQTTNKWPLHLNMHRRRRTRFANHRAISASAPGALSSSWPKTSAILREAGILGTSSIQSLSPIPRLTNRQQETKQDKPKPNERLLQDTIDVRFSNKLLLHKFQPQSNTCNDRSLYWYSNNEK